MTVNHTSVGSIPTAGANFNKEKLMYRVSKMGKSYFAKECSLQCEDDKDDIESLVWEDIPVLLVDGIEDVKHFNIDPDDIEIV